MEPKEGTDPTENSAETNQGEAQNVVSARTGVIRFFSNPWVGIIGSIASIIGVLLAVYFYFESVSYPEVVYYTNPVRTVVVQQGTASRLTVSFEGHPIAQDVTAVQIAIWNRGRQTIRKESVLRPVTIKTNPKVPILEATIQRTSRDVIGLNVDQSRVAQGEVLVSWNILEQSDGGVVQLVYASSPDTRIECDGVIEGQHAIRELKYRRKIASPGEQLQRDRWDKYVLLVAFVFALIGYTLFVVQEREQRAYDRKFSSLALPLGLRPRPFPFLRILTLINLFILVGLVALTVNMYWINPIPTPPFGFQQ